MVAVKASAVNSTAYRVWNRVKVSKELFDLLFTHPLFRKEPKAINTAQYWLSAMDAAMVGNDDKPVTWDWKDIQDRFRPYANPSTLYRDALRELGLITFTTYKPPPNAFVQGECRKFTVTPLGRRLVASANYQWLHNLLKDPQTRRRNQVAISKRKVTRKHYDDPMQKRIHLLNATVKFDEDEIFKQLEHDRVNKPGRYRSALHHLLALERKSFKGLEIKAGRIYHEWVGLPKPYRLFASVNGRRYSAILDIRCCHPTFLGRYLRESWDGLLKLCRDETDKPNPNKDLLKHGERLSKEVKFFELEDQCNRWTEFFTDPNTDPRDVLLRKLDITGTKQDVKDCLNWWVNGAKKYLRTTTGKWNATDTRKLEEWFGKNFSAMAQVWATFDRDKTGEAIMEEYELKLMLDPALYAFGDSLKLTLANEYDGVGVFAEPDEKGLLSKLERLKQYIQSQSAKKFDVPVVVKAEVLTL